MRFKVEFYRDLTNWYSENKRNLPWRGSRNPYLIWICEIIFQQTRINQGIAYYQRFTEKFPTLSSLANANEDEVLKQWEGLGYYSRARNLHFSAKMIQDEFNGEFPKDYQSLLKLKGVGCYTAAAIASICYDENIPAIDGNALRVYSRLTHSYLNIAQGSTLKYFFNLLHNTLPENPGDFNQAIMELGATICLPAQPKCEDCPVQKHCLAFEKNTQLLLPVNEKKIAHTYEKLNYYLYYNDEGLFVRKRKEAGIWRNLYELGTTAYFQPKKIKTLTHKLTHKTLTITFYIYELDGLERIEIENSSGLDWVEWGQMEPLIFPVPLKNFINNFAEISIFEKTSINY